MDERMELSSVERMIVDRAAKMHTPINGGFELTPYCNLACRMCYIRARRPGLPVLDADTWLSFARQAAMAGTLMIQLTGGEPLLHPQFKEIYAGLKAMGMIVSMNTNATLIDEEMADFLAADMPRRVSVSLYGPDRAAYEQLCGNGDAFDKTIRAIELMQARHIPVKINLTINSINYPRLDEMLAICRRYGLPMTTSAYMFDPVRQEDGGKQQYRLDVRCMADAMFKGDCYRVPKRRWPMYAESARQALAHFDPAAGEGEFVPLQCRAGTSGFWLCWDGRMNGCASMTQPRADVRELGFDAAWEAVKAYTKSLRVSARCAKCSLNMFCENCGVIAQQETGSFEGVPQLMCDEARMIVERIADSIKSENETEESR